MLSDFCGCSEVEGDTVNSVSLCIRDPHLICNPQETSDPATPAAATTAATATAASGMPPQTATGAMAMTNERKGKTSEGQQVWLPKHMPVMHSIPET